MADEKPLVEEDEVAFEEPQEEKTPEEIEKKDDKQPDDRRSAIAQKKYWRDKYQKEVEKSSKVETLEEELSKLKDAVKKPDDEQERKAQDYIRSQARSVYEELQKEKQKQESKELEEFEGKVESILDENPDFSEEELLDTIEEYEVEPAVALKILKKQHDSPKEKKPRMPQARRASPEEEKNKPDDSKKSMWDIVKEETAKLRNK